MKENKNNKLTNENDTLVTAGYKISALHEVYMNAFDKKDYVMCDKIRAEIQRALSGKSMLIKLEDELNLPSDLNSILLS